jgi:Protein of unknown function (DUF3500)
MKRSPPFVLVSMFVLVTEPAYADTELVAHAFRAAASALIAATPAPQRVELLHPLSDSARSNWHYTPRTRVGVPWKGMSSAQRAAAQQLLAAALSDAGLATVRAVMALEVALRELEGSSASLRDPLNYAFAIYGVPGDKLAWGWRIEGHHLSLHFSIDSAHVISSLPQFIGANPAEVPPDIEHGRHPGQRVLRDEEDRAFELLDSLTPPQRSAALIAERPYGDILTKNAAKVDPLDPYGLRFDQLGQAQRAQLLRVIQTFAGLVEPALAEQRLARVHAGALDSVRFAWAGAKERGCPYYYRIQGQTFLIELDNSGGNHIHSVWRDFEGDWGRDVLREHYRNGHEHSGRP